MSGAKHTPGPWRVTDRTHVRSERLELLALVWKSVAHSRDTEANARLIASAPELLEALEKVIAAADALFSSRDTVTALLEFGVTIESARAAKAKATGEAK